RTAPAGGVAGAVGGGRRGWFIRSPLSRTAGGPSPSRCRPRWAKARTRSPRDPVELRRLPSPLPCFARRSLDLPAGDGAGDELVDDGGPRVLDDGVPDAHGLPALLDSVALGDAGASGDRVPGLGLADAAGDLAVDDDLVGPLDVGLGE